MSLLPLNDMASVVDLGAFGGSGSSSGGLLLRMPTTHCDIDLR